MAEWHQIGNTVAVHISQQGLTRENYIEIGEKIPTEKNWKVSPLAD